MGPTPVSLPTSSGPIENLKVPRDREGEFRTQLFDRYSRYEQQVADGLTQMFVSGTSTQKVGEVAQTLMGIELAHLPIIPFS
jgi:putative transposase